MLNVPESRVIIDHYFDLEFSVYLVHSAAISSRLSDANSHESKDESSTNDGKSKSSSLEEDGSISDKLSALIGGITVHDRKWSDGSVPLDAVSANLAKLGKDAIERRTIAAAAAPKALQDALATDSLVRSLSMFSDICSTSKAGNPLPTIERFLSVYDNAMRSISLVDSVDSSHCSDTTDIVIYYARNFLLFLRLDQNLMCCVNCDH